jgi:hypothetical protein
MVRAERRAARGDGPAPTKILTAATLWEARYTDLQRLLRRRWWAGDLPAGQRDAWMFLACNAAAWLSPASVLPREFERIRGEACRGWDERELRSNMSSVLRRAEAHARRERVSWNGRATDPRYRFTNDSIITLLEITPTEMRELDLRVLIDPDVKRERDQVRWHERRAAAGGQSRADYLSNAEARRGRVAALRAGGMTWRAVADREGISVGAAHWLGQQGGENRVSPLYTRRDIEHATEHGPGA